MFPHVKMRVLTGLNGRPVRGLAGLFSVAGQGPAYSKCSKRAGCRSYLIEQVLHCGLGRDRGRLLHGQDPSGYIIAVAIIIIRLYLYW